MELSAKSHPTDLTDKLPVIMKHAPGGVAEIDNSGNIISLNNRGQNLLQSFFPGNDVTSRNFYEVLEIIAPSVAETINSFGEKSGLLLDNELHSFTFPGEATTEKHFIFTVARASVNCFIIFFDDITERRAKEKMAQQILADRTVIQGKFEITANVMHDIGNALVGLGSYLNRIKRSAESDNPANLFNLLDFFNGQKEAIAGVIGEVKAAAVIQIISGIAQTQKGNMQEISSAVTEQQRIISHIQEILNIHRQYISGNDVQEKRSMSIAGIIKDCMSMLLASFSKRDISVSIDMPQELPVIKGDRTRLMQVILNVLKNSIEAIEVYAVEKTISLRVTIEDNQMVIQVKDSGNGFDEATAGMLFKRGFTTKPTGSGLGLNGCKAIIESHEGTISISSDGIGKGAVTTIKLKI